MPFSLAPDNGRVNRVNRLIVNPVIGPTECGWLDCWNRAREGWGIRVHEHTRRLACGHPLSRHAHYNFCCEGHRDYFLAATGVMALDTGARNGGLISGMHTPGMRGGR